jgi:hypothetical protein
MLRKFYSAQKRSSNDQCNRKRFIEGINHFIIFFSILKLYVQLSLPPDAPEDMVSMMKNCMELKPEARPTFQRICGKFNTITINKQSIENFKRRVKDEIEMKYMDDL